MLSTTSFIVCILLAVLAIVALILSLKALGTRISDKYQSHRFNNGNCPNCGCRLNIFNDPYAPSCHGFYCVKCLYTTYVSKNNPFVNLDKFLQ